MSALKITRFAKIRPKNPPLTALTRNDTLYSSMEKMRKFKNGYIVVKTNRTNSIREHHLPIQPEEAEFGFMNMGEILDRCVSGSTLTGEHSWYNSGQEYDAVAGNGLLPIDDANAKIKIPQMILDEIGMPR